MKNSFSGCNGKFLLIKKAKNMITSKQALIRHSIRAVLFNPIIKNINRKIVRYISK